MPMLITWSIEMACCSRCDKSFPHPRAKQQHIADSPRHHVCYLCPQKDKPDYDSENDLDMHLELKHSVCSFCGDQFSSPSNLKNVRNDSILPVKTLPYFPSTLRSTLRKTSSAQDAIIGYLHVSRLCYYIWKPAAVKVASTLTSLMK